MIESGKFVGGLKAAGVEFFVGVPDSQLKSFCAYVTDTCGVNHVIATNEGGADKIGYFWDEDSWHSLMQHPLRLHELWFSVAELGVRLDD